MSAPASPRRSAMPGASVLLGASSLNREARAFTLRAFERMGYAPAASQTNFVMVDVRRDAKQFREACKREGVLIGRRFPPLDTYARVTVGTMDEMRRATEVFRKLLATA